MSRSEKKSPVFTEGYGTMSRKKAKKAANKRVRTKEDVPNGSAYKKISESYDIKDFKFRVTEQEILERYERYCLPEYYSHKNVTRAECEQSARRFKDKFPTAQDYLNYCNKYYRRK